MAEEDDFDALDVEHLHLDPSAPQAEKFKEFQKVCGHLFSVAFYINCAISWCFLQRICMLPALKCQMRADAEKRLTSSSESNSLWTQGKLWGWAKKVSKFFRECSLTAGGNHRWPLLEPFFEDGRCRGVCVCLCLFLCAIGFLERLFGNLCVFQFHLISAQLRSTFQQLDIAGCEANLVAPSKYGRDFCFEVIIANPR